MSLDATLSRIDGLPLGDRQTIVRIFEQHFSGIFFDWSPSGMDRIEAARRQGIEFPPPLREAMENIPRSFRGDWNGPDGCLELFWDGEAAATAINLEFRGVWETSDRIWDDILRHQEWQIEYHSTLIPQDKRVRR